MSSGLMYIVSGEQYVEEAKVSARSANEQMPDVSVAIVTDESVEATCFDDIIHVPTEDMRDDFGDHVIHLDKSPYERTVKIDTDIYFDHSIMDVFDLLDQFDVAAAHAPFRHASDRVDIPGLDGIPDSFPEYQGGVIAFRDNANFEDFRSRWVESYRDVLEEDEVFNQAALRVAMYYSDARIATLPEEYNCLFRMPGCANGPVKVFHGRLRDIEAKGAPKRAKVEQAVEVLNSHYGLRAHYRSGKRVKLAEPNVLMKAVDSVRREGLKYTFSRGLELFSSTFR